MKTPKIEALLKQIESGKIATDAAYILNEVKKKSLHGTTMPELEEIFTIKNISGRLSDLEDAGLIYKDGKMGAGDDCKVIDKQLTQSYSLFYYESDKIKQTERKATKHIEKYRQCVKRLQKDFDDIMPEKLKEELKNSLNVQTSLF